ncbi:hypothetical protein VNO78_18918 [Psophocarpus tetragonolobus]|uniref:Uncharacterized protein n=1 Tax=Psophocarpus tetragonolobus TaxID=3891 RepID=A0AAN9XFZ0_PSOTE
MGRGTLPFWLVTPKEFPAFPSLPLASAIFIIIKLTLSQREVSVVNSLHSFCLSLISLPHYSALSGIFWNNSI